MLSHSSREQITASHFLQITVLRILLPIKCQMLAIASRACGMLTETPFWGWQIYDNTGFNNSRAWIHRLVLVNPWKPDTNPWGGGGYDYPQANLTSQVMHIFSQVKSVFTSVIVFSLRLEIIPHSSSHHFNWFSRNFLNTIS